MTFLRQLLALSGVGIATAFISAAPASALTMSECSAKYNSAKEAGTLGGQTWNEFRKAACGAGAAMTAEPAQKPAKAATGSSEPAKGLTMQECSAKYNQAKQAGTLAGQTWNQFRSSQCSAAAMGGAATETDAEPAKGLTMKECSTKYNQAKQAGTLGGQTWNQFRASQCSAAAVQSGAAAKTTAAAATGKGLTMKQCSVKYGAAKDAGTLGGLTWNQFRKAQCGPAAAEDDTVPYVGQAKYTGDPEAPTIAAPRGVKFPRAVARKYADESPGKARMHTCLDQYYANKDSDALGGLRWIQKGGGYYSLCNAKLKGNLAG
jgi:hypothetical protein